MITIKNYNEQKDIWNWKHFPETVQENRNDIEEMMEFYDDDKDIKETIDLFLKSINKSLEPKGEIIIVNSKNQKPKKETSNKKETILETLQNTKYVKKVMPKHQQEILLGYERSEEKEYFIQLIKDLEKDFDLARKRQDKKAMDSIVKAHYFYGGSDWYIFDYDPSENMFFGYVVLNGDTQMSESGYISVDELQSIKGLELDFHFTQKELGKILHSTYPGEFPEYGKETKKEIEPTKKTTKKPTTKVKKVVSEKQLVDNNSIEFLLIRRFYNILKKGSDAVIPFNTIRLLYAAFNKAAVERKVRKTSDFADLFNSCNEKLSVIFEEYANPSKMDVKIEFSDKKLFSEIEEFATNKKVNPSVALMKRFIAMQGTLPEVKKAETLLKSITKQLENSNDRLKPELLTAKKELETYLYNPKEKIEVFHYGLSVPRNVCTNRIKCAGVDKSGKLHKGYKFQEHTGYVVKVKGNSTKTSKKKVKSKKKNVGLAGSLDNIPVFGTVKNQPIFTVPIVAETQPVEMPVETLQKNYNIPAENKQPEHEKNPPFNQPKPVVKNKLMSMQFDSLEMDEGWEELMQEPAKNLKLAIWGKPKNGKTAGALQLANYLTKFGNVLYNFVDQGFNKSTQDLWEMNGLANNSAAEPSDVCTLDDLEKLIATGKYTFVFIDMINDYIRNEQIKPEEFKNRFIRKYPNVSFILIFEVTKSGDFKGDQGWTHLVDAIATVDGFIMENRGRYGMGTRILWEEGARKFNPKRYNEILQEQLENVQVAQTV